MSTTSMYEDSLNSNMTSPTRMQMYLLRGNKVVERKHHLGSRGGVGVYKSGYFQDNSIQDNNVVEERGNIRLGSESRTSRVDNEYTKGRNKTLKNNTRSARASKNIREMVRSNSKEDLTPGRRSPDLLDVPPSIADKMLLVLAKYIQKQNRKSGCVLSDSLEETISDVSVTSLSETPEEARGHGSGCLSDEDKIAMLAVSKNCQSLPGIGERQKTPPETLQRKFGSSKSVKESRIRDVHPQNVSDPEPRRLKVKAKGNKPRKPITKVSGAKSNMKNRDTSKVSFDVSSPSLSSLEVRAEQNPESSEKNSNSLSEGRNCKDVGLPPLRCHSEHRSSSTDTSSTVLADNSSEISTDSSTSPSLKASLAEKMFSKLGSKKTPTNAELRQFYETCCSLKCAENSTISSRDETTPTIRKSSHSYLKKKAESPAVWKGARPKVAHINAIKTRISSSRNGVRKSVPSERCNGYQSAKYVSESNQLVVNHKNSGGGDAITTTGNYLKHRKRMINGYEDTIVCGESQIERIQNDITDTKSWIQKEVEASICRRMAKVKLESKGKHKQGCAARQPNTGTTRSTVKSMPSADKRYMEENACYNLAVCNLQSNLSVSGVGSCMPVKDTLFNSVLSRKQEIVSAHKVNLSENVGDKQKSCCNRNCTNIAPDGALCLQEDPSSEVRSAPSGTTLQTSLIEMALTKIGNKRNPSTAELRNFYEACCFIDVNLEESLKPTERKQIYAATKKLTRASEVRKQHSNDASSSRLTQALIKSKLRANSQQSTDPILKSNLSLSSISSNEYRQGNSDVFKETRMGRVSKYPHSWSKVTSEHSARSHLTALRDGQSNEKVPSDIPAMRPGSPVTYSRGIEGPIASVKDINSSYRRSDITTRRRCIDISKHTEPTNNQSTHPREMTTPPQGVEDASCGYSRDMKRRNSHIQKTRVCFQPLLEEASSSTSTITPSRQPPGRGSVRGVDSFSDYVSISSSDESQTLTYTSPSEYLQIQQCQTHQKTSIGADEYEQELEKHQHLGEVTSSREHHTGSTPVDVPGDEVSSQEELQSSHTFWQTVYISLFATVVIVWVVILLVFNKEDNKTHE